MTVSVISGWKRNDLAIRVIEKKKVAASKAVVTPKSVNPQSTTQKPMQSIAKSAVPDTGFQLSKSTSKTELSGGMSNAAKTNSIGDDSHIVDYENFY